MYQRKCSHTAKISVKCVAILLAAVLFSALWPGGQVEGHRGATTKEREKEMFFTLTKEEEDYLSELSGRPLLFGVCETGIREDKDKNTVWGGVAAPLLDVLRYEFGLEPELVCGTWEENLSALEAGKLDFLFGVPKGWRENEVGGDGTIVSAWLCESPYVLAEYVGDIPAEGEAGEDVESEKAAGIAYVMENPMAEELLSKFSVLFVHPLGAGGGVAEMAGDNMENLSLFTCVDEDAVFDALENGMAAFGLLPEDALFSRYPATDYKIVYKISQYSGQMAVCTMKQEYAPLVQILDRYLTQTQEGDMLREAIRTRQQSIRQEKIFAGEKKVLTRLAARGGDFQYAQAGLDGVPFFWHNGDGAHGELVDFLAFVEDVTGFSFQESSYVGAQAVQALDDGEILFVSGMPFIGGGQAYCFATTGMDWLVPVVPAADKEVFCVGEEEVRTVLTQRYWGVVQDFLPLLSGTEFDGHTVGFSDGKALYEAMQRGEISGMLIGQENYDALLLSGGIGYVMLMDPVLLEIRFPFACGLAFVKENREEAECFGRLWEFYRLLHTEDESAAGWYRAEFEKVKREVSGLTRAVWGLGAAVVLFLAAFVLSRRAAKRKRRG